MNLVPKFPPAPMKKPVEKKNAKKSKRYAEFRRWPAYEKLYIQAFDRMLDERRARGKLDGNWMKGGTGQDVFRWWMEEDVLPGQMSMEDFT